MKPAPQVRNVSYINGWALFMDGTGCKECYEEDAPHSVRVGTRLGVLRAPG